MYNTLAVTSSGFRIMMFPHNEKIITIVQLTYYVKTTSPTPGSVFPLFSSSHELITTYTKLNPS